ncbi:hypothetical protein FEM33_26040 [Dyadobacter flavalbus]|uniref:Porin family protein n=1 Tax=Dyadobacter flavalbus TaxID=2579942 RepID=A0A5M8Q6L6_9BACT|nr:hypothetical protein [Dyadobacter flavalbus]KAA6430460.1 hypothetical protein FEM33_26040 [Dyadobacter flavalbus]
MKKLLLIGLLGIFCLAGETMAQIPAGTRYRAATLSFQGSHQKGKNAFSDSRNSSVSFSPSVQFGRFTGNNKMLGLGLGANFDFLKGTDTAPNEDMNRRYINAAYTLSPFIRHYKTLNEKWYAFLNTSVYGSYLRSALLSNDIMEKYTKNGYAAGLSVVPGIAYRLKSRFALEADVNLLSLGIGYRHMNDTNSITFNSAVTTGLTSYFSLRASWYIQKAN